MRRTTAKGGKKRRVDADIVESDDDGAAQTSLLQQGHEFGKPSFAHVNERLAQKENEALLVQTGQAKSFSSAVGEKHQKLAELLRGGASLSQLRGEATQMRLSRMLDANALRARGASVAGVAGLSRAEKVARIKQLLLPQSGANPEPETLLHEGTASSSAPATGPGPAGASTTHNWVGDRLLKKQAVLKKLCRALDERTKNPGTACADKHVDADRARGSILMARLQRLVDDVRDKVVDGHKIEVDVGEQTTAGTGCEQDVAMTDARADVELQQEKTRRRQFLLEAIRRQAGDASSTSSPHLQENTSRVTTVDVVGGGTKGQQGDATSTKSSCEVVRIDETQYRALFRPATQNAHEALELARNAIAQDPRDPKTAEFVRNALRLSKSTECGLDRTGALRLVHDVSSGVGAGGGPQATRSASASSTTSHLDLLAEKIAAAASSQNGNCAGYAFGAQGTDTDLFSQDADGCWDVFYAGGRLSAVYRPAAASNEGSAGGTTSTTAMKSTSSTYCHSSRPRTTWTVNVDYRPQFLAVSRTLTLLVYHDHFCGYHTETGILAIPNALLPTDGPVASVAVSARRFMILTHEGDLFCWNFHGLIPGREPVSLLFSRSVLHFSKIVTMGFTAEPECVPFLRGRTHNELGSMIEDFTYAYNPSSTGFQIVPHYSTDSMAFFGHVLLGDKAAANEALERFIDHCYREPSEGVPALRKFCSDLTVGLEICSSSDERGNIRHRDHDQIAPASRMAGSSGPPPRQTPRQNGRPTPTTTSAGREVHGSLFSAARNTSNPGEAQMVFLLRRLEQVYLQSAKAFLWHWVLPKIGKLACPKLQGLYEDEYERLTSLGGGACLLVTDWAERQRLYSHPDLMKF